MTSRTDPAVAVESDRASAPEAVLWHHAAFCRLGLPVAPGTEPWRREAAGAVVRIAPGTAGETLPDGAGLRLLLAFLCDSALRGGTPTVVFGADSAALAARMGLTEGAAAPLAEQVERLLAARITVAIDDGPELSVLDARSRPRGGGWPAQVKLNARFLTSLQENAVALDRAILRGLSGSAEAMDAHGWTREALSRGAAAEAVTTPWPELMARFGAPGATAGEVRAAFESALRQVFEADLSIELAVDDEGVSVRRAQEAASEPAPEAAPAAVAEADAEAAPMAEAPPAAMPAPAPAMASPAAPAPVPARPDARESAPPSGDVPRPERRSREEGAREERNREDRGRDDRSREPRQGEDRPREDRVREDRVRDDRPRDERPRDGRRRDERREEAGEGAVDAIMDDMVRLRSHLTGLPQVVWLRRGHGDENILVAVTPGTRLDTDRMTLLMVEPIVMQVSGGLGQHDFERVSAWVMANRDLIDEFWEGGIASADEVGRRVRKAPGPSWR